MAAGQDAVRKKGQVMASRGWRATLGERAHGNAGSVVPAAIARPSLACYSPILVPALLHALAAGLVQ